MNKIISICVLLLAWTFAKAETNLSWVTVAGGTLESTCRSLWKEYDSIYNTNTAVIPGRPGQGGGLAVEDVLRSEKVNSTICMGMSQLFLNPLLFPGQTKEDQLEPLIIVTRTPFVLYVPNDVPANNYQDAITYFRSLKRPINVGMFLPIFRATSLVLEQRGITVNAVPFKNSPQQYSSLADGSLDLAFDAGQGFLIAHQTKKFKAIAYIDSEENSQFQGIKNIINVEPDLRVIQAASMLIVSAPKNMPSHLKKMFAERLKKAVESDGFKNSVSKLGSQPLGIVEPQLTTNIEFHQRLVTKFWK